MTDATPLCMTDDEVAAALAMSKETFRRRRAELERDGFPRRDPVMRRYIRADVLAYIASKRQIADSVYTADATAQEPDLDAL